ncbi:MAG TPA: hypothetical protein VJK54_07920 [Chthoniobacterales bacterium]|nr:hypothetical protein [Chthoniobacterales bacterium]
MHSIHTTTSQSDPLVQILPPKEGNLNAYPQFTFDHFVSKAKSLLPEESLMIDQGHLEAAPILFDQDHELSISLGAHDYESQINHEIVNAFKLALSNKYGSDTSWIFPPEEEAEARVSGLKAKSIIQIDKDLNKSVDEALLQEIPPGSFIPIENHNNNTFHPLSTEDRHVSDDVLTTLLESDEEEIPSPLNTVTTESPVDGKTTTSSLMSDSPSSSDYGTTPTSSISSNSSKKRAIDSDLEQPRAKKTRSPYKKISSDLVQEIKNQALLDYQSAINHGKTAKEAKVIVAENAIKTTYVKTSFDKTNATIIFDISRSSARHALNALNLPPDEVMSISSKVAYDFKNMMK